MNDARQAFSCSLKTRREQLGITIPEIAATTKISGSLLEALERSDLSRWPKGIFRRAFFREYVTAIGLSPEPLVSEFARLFPDEAGVPQLPERPAEFRLELAGTQTPAAATKTGKRVAVVAAELAAIVAIGAAGAWLLEADIWSASGVIALIYYPASNLCVERRWGLRRLQVLIKSQLPGPGTQPRRRESIDGREELQVSY